MESHFPPTASRLAIGFDAVRLWDIASGKEVRRFNGGIVYCVAFSPDGKQILTGGLSKTVRLWDAATGREIRRFDAYADRVDCVAFSPNGKQVLIGGKSASLWDIGGTKEVRRFEGSLYMGAHATFAPDGKGMLTAGSDVFRLWEVDTGKLLRAFAPGAAPLAFSPDSKRMLVLDGFGAHLCDAKSGKEISKINDHMYVGFANVAFSPDGKKVVAADGLWNADTGGQIWRFDRTDQR